MWLPKELFWTLRNMKGKVLVVCWDRYKKMFPIIYRAALSFICTEIHLFNCTYVCTVLFFHFFEGWKLKSLVCFLQSIHNFTTVFKFVIIFFCYISAVRSWTCELQALGTNLGIIITKLFWKQQKTCNISEIWHVLWT